jgi:hypothetical protein
MSSRWGDEDDDEVKFTINDIDKMIREQVDNLGKLQIKTDDEQSFTNQDDNKEEVKPVKQQRKKNSWKKKNQNKTVFDYDISDKQLNNNIYVDKTEDYVFYLERNVRPCKFGINCFRVKCDFMHVFPEAECEVTYTGKICGNINTCDKIHQKRCKYDLECNKKDCSFKHSTDMPTPESQAEYVKNMKKYLNL